MNYTTFKKFLLINICRILPLIALIYAIYLMYTLWTNDENWGTSNKDNYKLKSTRHANRGIFVAIIIAILLNIIAPIMAYLGIREELIVINCGFILISVIGFLLDQGISLDKGLASWNISFVKGIKFTIESLASSNFLRYIVTVFLDLFINTPLHDIIISQVDEAGIIDKLKTSKGLIGKWDNFIAMNFPTILQSIVGFITFQAYINKTRFNWAYPEHAAPGEFRISPGTIIISTAIASIVYLTFYKIMDYIFKNTYFNINSKLAYVIFTILLLYVLNEFKTIEAHVGDEHTSTLFIGEKYNYLIGISLAIVFILYGLVYPFYTVLIK